MPWPIMRSNPNIRIVPCQPPPAKRSRRNCAACGPSSASCAPTMQPSPSRRARGDFPALPPRRPRRNSAPRSPRPVAEAQKGQEVVKLSTERKHVTNVLRMVAYQMGSDLLELIAPHYERAEDDVGTVLPASLQDAGGLDAV